MIPKVYKPEIFQGNLKKKSYFEGWYFKHVSKDLDHVWSFIPGISLTKDDTHSFIQVINGITGDSEYISYKLDEFTWDKKSLYLKIANSVFTSTYIDLNIRNEKFKIKGRVEYSDCIKYPGKLFSPGIMGWYSFVPFMECKHGVVSVNHDVSGCLNVNGNNIDFNNGKGYIEKDWGTSFPEAWLWVQANNFNNRNSSFHFSVAKIPWLGKYFIGFIAFLYYNDKFHMFSTYNKSEISEIEHLGESIAIVMKNHDSILKARVKKSTFGELRAPVSGNMSRRIKESIDSEVTISLFDKHNNLIYSDSSKRAGLEYIEKIFEYL
ncbi:MAG: tocopherol cyclase family protein [Bacteroidales bacterium]